MKIAYFTSNRTSFPPDSSEIIASATITMQLITRLSRKHEITIFAAKGSQIENTKIVDLNLPPFAIDSDMMENDWIIKVSQGMKQLYIGELFNQAENFDLIHLQTEPIYLAMPYINLIKTPVLFTCHNVYHTPEENIFKFYDNKTYFSALSRSQASQFPLTQQIPVIYNGIEVNKYPFQQTSKEYFLHIGRLQRIKGVEVFLELAKKLPQNVFYISGKGSVTYEEKIKSFAREYENIHYSGMLPYESIEWFNMYSQAKAFIFPIQWEEPFGLVMIEAMACGTPVIAYNRGSVSEIVKDGVTGFIVDPDDNERPGKGNWIIKKQGIDGLIEAIQKIGEIDRLACRKHVEENFTVEKMVDGYEELYRKILSKKV